MTILVSLLAVLVLILLPIAAFAAGLKGLIGIAVPYIAIALFIGGIVYRVVKWGRSPVPFRIPTTAGQQKSLRWLASSKLDNPHSTFGVIGRMALEVLLFRSLFRNTRAELREGPKLVYSANKWLWAGSLTFHWSFLVILLRHVRFFAEPVPAFVGFIEGFDGFFQVGLPVILVTDMVILAALTFLFLRRIFDSRLRYFSLVADYFPLFLLLSIAVTGILMRYFVRTDIVAVKELAMGLVTFRPAIPDAIGVMFFIHLFLVSALFAYFPFSKLMHAGGIFLSPTRNLANNNRARRHLNPWNRPVKVHTYEEYEDEFHDVMAAAGMPLEKKDS